MKTPKKTTYYLIIEMNGHLIKKNVHKMVSIRGLYTTQAKAIAELFHLASKYQDEGARFCDTPQEPCPISQLIHSQTHNGETEIMGYNPFKTLIFSFQIKPITLDIPSLITT